MMKDWLWRIERVVEEKVESNSKDVSALDYAKVHVGSSFFTPAYLGLGSGFIQDPIGYTNCSKLIVYILDIFEYFGIFLYTFV